MRGHGIRFLITAALMTIAGMTRADEPAAPEPIPAPKVVPAEIVTEFAWRYSAYTPVGKMETWQYFGVDRRGGFRLRVINSPSGAYYLYNGAPYPWTTVNPQNFMPYVVGD